MILPEDRNHHVCLLLPSLSCHLFWPHSNMSILIIMASLGLVSIPETITDWTCISCINCLMMASPTLSISAQWGGLGSSVEQLVGWGTQIRGRGGYAFCTLKDPVCSGTHPPPSDPSPSPGMPPPPPGCWPLLCWGKSFQKWYVQALACKGQERKLTCLA